MSKNIVSVQIYWELYVVALLSNSLTTFKCFHSIIIISFGYLLHSKVVGSGTLGVVQLTTQRPLSKKLQHISGPSQESKE